jgi:hypothetical protein
MLESPALESREGTVESWGALVLSGPPESGTNDIGASVPGPPSGVAWVGSLPAHANSSDATKNHEIVERRRKGVTTSSPRKRKRARDA